VACDNNPQARIVYEENFKKRTPSLFRKCFFFEDVFSIDPQKLPPFDLLCAGFPCQPFSQAGFKKGFADKGRGDIFFEICRIASELKTPILLLENVAHLVKHDNGKTFALMLKKLSDLGYATYHRVIRASEHGLPQHRPRVFIVCFLQSRLKRKAPPFQFPEPSASKITMSDIWGGCCDRDIGFTLRCGGRRSGINNRWNWDAYCVNGEVRYLSPLEGKRMMGFPDRFKMSINEKNAMRLLGNSVAVPVVRAVTASIISFANQWMKKRG